MTWGFGVAIVGDAESAVKFDMAAISFGAPRAHTPGALGSSLG